VSTNQPATNEALTPLHEGQRAFGWRDHTSLWFSLGVGLLVMQMGAYLLPGLSPGEALVAIAIGSIVGSGLLGWVGKLGCDSGLASAGLMHAVYGRRFAGLPIVLNVLQVLGWGAFALVIMRDAPVAIGRQSGGLTAGYWSVLAPLMWGAVVLLLISGSMVRLVRRLISRIALPLVVLSLLWLSWQFATLAQTQGLAPLWGRGGDGSMSALSAIDLVIAMPVSWLPLVADYARHGRNGRSALHGTWLGYAVANIWCYGLGVLVALVLPSEDLVTALLLAQGGLIALSLIIVDEIDTTYGDVYSGSVCMHSLLPRWSIRRWGVLMVLACTAFALVLPMHSLEPFLLLLGSVFVPLFGVILGRLAFGAPTRQLLHEAGSIHWGATLIWLAGIAFYHLLPRLAPALGGSALPTLVLCFALAWLSRSSFK